MAIFPFPRDRARNRAGFPSIRDLLRRLPKPLLTPRLWAVLLVFVMALPILPATLMAAQQHAPGNLPEVIASVERHKLAIDQIESSLKREDLNDETLAGIRASLDPLRTKLRTDIEALDRGLSDVDARLKQLGLPPSADAPPEDSVLSADRARFKQERTAIDGGLKQARLLMVQTDEISARITERRLALFTSALFGRGSSILSMSFWRDAVREVPEEIRSLSFLAEGWWNYALANGGVWGIAGGALTLILLGAAGPFVVRWLRDERAIPVLVETRFDKAFLALATLLRVALVTPISIVVAILVVNVFGLVPLRIMEMAFGAVTAIAIASFGRGVAVGLFAPYEPERRLLSIADDSAQLIARHMIAAARILGIVVLVTTVQRTLVAPVSLTVATSALFSIAIAATFAHFLFKIGPRNAVEEAEDADDDVSHVHLFRSIGWLLVIAIIAALATGFIAFASFVAGRLLVGIGVISALYIVLVFIDSFFGEVLTANSAQGRSLARFFGLKPRAVELFGTLISALIRSLLVIVVLAPLLLGSWGIFAADMFGMLQNIMLGIQIGGVIISPSVILTAIVILLAGILLTRWVQSWLNTRFLPRTTLDPGLQNSVSTIIGYIGVIGAVLLALTQLGLDFQQITIVAGALSIGIGFGLQSVVSNFVSGLILLAERPIRVGDVINVKGEEGKVQRIHVRATEIETGDNASLIIPNSELITGTVKNWTHTNTLKRIVVKVGVDYGSDVQKVRDILLEIAKSQTKLATSPAPQALITGFGDNAINFELSGVVRNIGDGGVVKSNLYYAILTRFREEGIVIPRPLLRIIPPLPESETLGE